jgi:hypothetical protein
MKQIGEKWIKLRIFQDFVVTSQGWDVMVKERKPSWTVCDVVITTILILFALFRIVIFLTLSILTLCKVNGFEMPEVFPRGFPKRISTASATHNRGQEQ